MTDKPPRARIEVFHASEISRQDRRLLAVWFRREFKWDMDKNAPIDWHVLVHVKKELVGHVGIVLRDATVGGQAVRLGGISAVIVDPGWRGYGFGSRAMQRAVQFMRAQTAVAHGFLICESHRVTFYEGLGWQAVPGPMVFTDWEGARVESGHHLMVLSLRGEPFPPGVIDLCGLPW
jgi:GNAT superfamily N-acetyltransferase